jgi:hypothetical protein
MKYVYLVMSGEGYGRVLAVCESEHTATVYVNTNARINWDIDPNKEPLDFSGALMRYGWADKCWWQKEVVYD